MFSRDVQPLNEYSLWQRHSETPRNFWSPMLSPETWDHLDVPLAVPLGELGWHGGHQWPLRVRSLHVCWLSGELNQTWESLFGFSGSWQLCPQIHVFRYMSMSYACTWEKSTPCSYENECYGKVKCPAILQPLTLITFFNNLMLSSRPFYKLPPFSPFLGYRTSSKKKEYHLFLPRSIVPYRTRKLWTKRWNKAS